MKDLHQYQECLLEVMNELKEYAVVVEGKNDQKALAKLGVKSIPIQGMPLDAFVENLGRKNVSEVVLLVDYDREGQKIFLKLKKLLQKYRIKCNARLRRKLMQFGRTRIEDFNGVGSSLDFSLSLSQIGSEQGLISPVKTKRGDGYGKTSSYFHKVPGKSSTESERCCGKKRCDRRNIRSD